MATETITAAARTVEPSGERQNITVPELASRLCIGLTLAWGLVRRGEIGSVKIGGARRVPLTEIGAYLSRVACPAKQK
jgi:excisionase family DNA binding protein